ncbi:Hypothetical_protein [Hexamita inflata]|uniref:Hypothetical_protein n=1 Tax=Hexamita inflata TaxID=28002 RepID=A0AA86UG05_9EUKA|nr:Hypothetical protein HINF_LOCUS38071 [Hexamita inflata]
MIPKFNTTFHSASNNLIYRLIELTIFQQGCSYYKMIHLSQRNIKVKQLLVLVTAVFNFRISDFNLRTGVQEQLIIVQEQLITYSNSHVGIKVTPFKEMTIAKRIL